ncbi:hypothetical protein ACOSQ4_017242 [Xanthoceras sorbifolium]
MLLAWLPEYCGHYRLVGHVVRECTEIEPATDLSKVPQDYGLWLRDISPSHSLLARTRRDSSKEASGSFVRTDEGSSDQVGMKQSIVHEQIGLVLPVTVGPGMNIDGRDGNKGDPSQQEKLTLHDTIHAHVEEGISLHTKVSNILATKFVGHSNWLEAQHGSLFGR